MSAKWTFAVLIEVETGTEISGREIKEISTCLNDLVKTWIQENDYPSDYIQERLGRELLGVAVK